MAARNDASSRQPQPTEFEARRAELVGQIGDSLDQVLSQMNALNRSLESIIEIGNEFASVEALWSQFETVMDSQKAVDAEGEGEQQQQQQQQQQMQQMQEGGRGEER